MLKMRDLPGIFLLALLWSPTFLIVRIGVAEIPPITLTLMRILFGAFTLVVVSLILCRNLFSYFKDGWPLLVTAIILTAVPFTLCSVGEVHIDSSTAGIIEGSTPIFTLLLAHFVFRCRDIDKGQVIAILLGFLGLLVIFAPTIGDGDPTSSFGFFALLTMAFFFALGFLYSERYLKNVPTLESTTIQMVFAGIILLPLAHFAEQPLFTVSPSLWILFLVFLLGAVGTSAAWVTYFAMVKRAGARNVSLATMLLPILTLIWGSLFLSEPITWYKIVGIVIVLASVFSMSAVGRDIASRLYQKVHRSNHHKR